MNLPDKKYSIIYADPPWSYKVWSGKGKTAANHYRTMDLKSIKALPVKDIAAENCVLFLWATYPCLQEAFEVIKAWGFIYKTVAFTWVKRNKKSNGWFWGLGYWTRANPEICLLATKGKPKRKSAAVHSVIDAPRREHSRKPDEVRNGITSLMGELPRIELFAREAADGWESWGNETDKFDNPKQGSIFESRSELMPM